MARVKQVAQSVRLSSWNWINKFQLFYRHFNKLTAKQANFRVRLSGSEHLSTTSWITLFAACCQTTAKLIPLAYDFSLQKHKNIFILPYKWTIKVGAVATHVANGTASFCSYIRIFIRQVVLQKSNKSSFINGCIKILAQSSYISLYIQFIIAV